MSYVSEHGAAYPLNIGGDYSEEQRNQMTFYLIKNHLLDYKSSHCTPLPAEFFKQAWNLPIENDYVITWERHCFSINPWKSFMHWSTANKNYINAWHLTSVLFFIIDSKVSKEKK